MGITDRYASAVHSSDMRSAAATTSSDSDVIGAFGLASKRHPLAVALARLFAGDNHAVNALTELLSSMVQRRADNRRIRLHWTQAQDLARSVVAWHRDGRCKQCDGHGYQRIADTPSLSDAPCRACHGTTKVPFEPQFQPATRPLAQWLLSEIEREQAKAGAAAMACLAPRLNL